MLLHNVDKVLGTNKFNKVSESRSSYSTGSRELNPEKLVLRLRPDQYLILFFDQEICIESSTFSPFEYIFDSRHVPCLDLSKYIILDVFERKIVLESKKTVS